MKPELLSPAGNIEQLRAAVYCGADAVYLGLSNFNARRRADNFTYENIGEVIGFCHLYGVKVYIAVNTAIKNSEIDEVTKLITVCSEASADAFIVSDLALINIIKNISKAPIHLSTQAGIGNLEGAKYAEMLGVDRVILSRETKIDDIKLIKQNTNLEIECFVHGALCVAFSGKCLLSSITNGNSGNRGLCMQPCRLQYNCKDKEGYLLSTSDLCLLDKLDKLYEAGVCSYKIEGRARSQEYVAETVSVYRKAIDNNFKYFKGDFDRLKAVFNRGDYTVGYNFSETTADLMSTKVPSNMGIKVGEIYKTDKVKKLAYVSTDFELLNGDGYKLIKDGVELGGGDLEIISKIQNGYIISTEAEIGGELHITKNKTLIKKVNEITRQLPVSFSFSVDENGYAEVIVKCNNITAEIISETPVQEARSSGITYEEIAASLSKCGGTEFVCSEVKASRFEGKFIAKSQLNDLRRRALEELKKLMINAYNTAKICAKNAKSINSIINFGQINNTSVAVELSNINQLTDNLLKDKKVVVIYSPSNYSVYDSKTFLQKIKRLQNDTEVFIKFTANANGKDILLYRSILESCGFDGIYADNYYAVQLAYEYKLKVFAGFGLNIFNNLCLNQIVNLAYYAASAELNTEELKHFKKPFIYAYGYMPLMHLTYCPSQLISGGNCGNCNYKNPLIYTDKNNFKFEVSRVKASSCYFTLSNSVITDISKKFGKIPFNYYLNMVQLASSEVEKVLDGFYNKIPLDNQNFTYGHLFRGVE